MTTLKLLGKVLLSTTVASVIVTVQSLPTTVPLLVGFAIGISGEVFPMRFFEISAQVIPVFFLALALELRAFTIPPFKIPDPDDPEWVKKVIKSSTTLNSWAVTFAALLALVVGEIFALLTVANGHPSWKFGQGIVLGGCFAGIVMIGYASLRTARTPPAS